MIKKKKIKIKMNVCKKCGAIANFKLEDSCPICYLRIDMLKQRRK